MPMQMKSFEGLKRVTSSSRLRITESNVATDTPIDSCAVVEPAF